MSIVAMTRVASHRRREAKGEEESGATAAASFKQAGGSADAEAQAVAAAVAAARKAAEDAATEAAKAAEKARKNVMTYIPTEVITVYIAAVGVFLGADGAGHVDKWLLFWIAWIATPVTFLLMFLGSVKIEEKRIPWKPKEWPWWGLIASFVAFWGWAFAIPNSPYHDCAWYTAAIGGFGVLVVSTLLGIFARIFG